MIPPQLHKADELGDCEVWLARDGESPVQAELVHLSEGEIAISFPEGNQTRSLTGGQILPLTLRFAGFLPIRDAAARVDARRKVEERMQYRLVFEAWSEVNEALPLHVQAVLSRRSGVRVTIPPDSAHVRVKEIRSQRESRPRIVDISVGGLQLAYPPKCGLKIGEKIAISLWLPGRQNPIFAAAQVVSSRTDIDADRCGVRFLTWADASITGQRHVAAYVERRLRDIERAKRMPLLGPALSSSN